MTKHTMLYLFPLVITCPPCNDELERQCASSKQLLHLLYSLKPLRVRLVKLRRKATSPAHFGSTATSPVCGERRYAKEFPPFTELLVLKFISLLVYALRVKVSRIVLLDHHIPTCREPTLSLDQFLYILFLEFLPHKIDMSWYV